MKKIVLKIIKMLNSKDVIYFKIFYWTIAFVILAVFFQYIFSPYNPKKYPYVNFSDCDGNSYVCFVVNKTNKIYKEGVYCKIGFKSYLMSKDPKYFDVLIRKIKENKRLTIDDFSIKADYENKN